MSEKRKKIIAATIVALAVTVIALVLILITTNSSLSEAQRKIDEVVLVENDLSESEQGGLITASQSWVFYSNASCITKEPLPAPDGKISEILSSLVKQGRLTALQSNLLTLKYEKIITVENGDYKKVFYSVGDYFITAE